MPSVLMLYAARCMLRVVCCILFLHIAAGMPLSLRDQSCGPSRALLLRWSTVPRQVHVPRSCVVRSWTLLHEETRFAGGDESDGSATLRPRATPYTLHFSSTLPYTGRVQISVRRTPHAWILRVL